MQGGPSSGGWAVARMLAAVVGIALLAGACGASVGPTGSAGSPGPTGSAGSPGSPGSLGGSAGAPSGDGSGAAARESASAGPVRSGSAGPTPRPVVAVTGKGFVDSRTFKLAAASYVVRWTITSSDSGGCAVIGAIHSPDGSISVEVANATLAGKGTRSGSKSAPKLSAGTYLITFATTCSWTAQVYRAQ